MSLNEQFLNLYKQLEDLLDKRYPRKGANSSIWLYEKESEKELSKQLSIIRETRNFLAHTPQLNEADVVEVTEEAIQFIQNIITGLENPITALSISTKRSDLVMGTLDTKLVEAIQQMKQKGFSHFPILDKRDHLLGVFSESTVFSYLLDHGSLTIETEILLREFSDYIEIANHRNESFEFIAKNTSIEEVKLLFEQQYAKDKKLAILFITEGGYMDQKILGIITPWDVLKKK